jgi:hypothetical protein
MKTGSRASRGRLLSSLAPPTCLTTYSVPSPLKIQDVGCVSNGLSRDPFQYSPLHQKRAICCPTKCQVCTHILCCRVDITGNWTVSFFRLFSHATNLLFKYKDIKRLHILHVFDAAVALDCEDQKDHGASQI